MQKNVATILKYFLIAIAIILALGLIIWPFAETMSKESFHVMFIVGAALTVGVGTGLRLGSRSGIGLGIGIGAVVGLAASMVLASFEGPIGPGEIIPPIVGIAIGFIDGIGTERLRGRGTSLIVSVSIGALVGLGSVPSIGWQGLVAACIAGVFVGTAADMRMSPEGGWLAGLRRPPLAIIMLNLLLIALLWFMVIRSSEGTLRWWITFLILPALVIYPIAGFTIGRWLALWMRPRIQVFRELLCYLQVMWIPMGAFALGYTVIILVFAGFYGTLHIYSSPPPFEGVDQPTILDWIFFSFLTATTMGSENVIPLSRGAQFLVGLETIAGLSWIIIMFAAVMSHLQPQFERIARNKAGEQTLKRDPQT